MTMVSFSTWYRDLANSLKTGVWRFGIVRRTFSQRWSGIVMKQLGQELPGWNPFNYQEE